MTIGYARVSTVDQNLDLQKEALRKAGCERIYEDKASGKDRDRRGLEQALDALREGDTFIVWKLDRLGRTVRDLIEMVNELEKRGIDFRSLQDNIDTTSAMGRAFFNLTATFAQMEREIALERTMAGLAVARAKGRKGGPPTKLTAAKQKKVRELIAQGVSYSDISNVVGLSLTTLYRVFPAAQQVRPEPVYYTEYNNQNEEEASN